MDNLIKVKGAKQHNLKNVDLEIPKNALVCFTGVSGSGKSSMAFDTIYAEGQRRYVESLSSYARQFLGVMEKPDVEMIEGLSPSISIDQKTTSKNPRSTVGTITEIYDYLRLLFARVGRPHCPICGREIERQTLDQIVENVINDIRLELASKKVIKFMVLSPVVIDKKGEFSSLFDNLKAKGYREVRVDNVFKNISEDFYLIKTNKHSIDVVIDKISFSINDFRNELFKKNLISRLNESVEQSLNLSQGLSVISFIYDKSFDAEGLPKKTSDKLYSEKFACPVDNVQIAEIEPRSFSFNSPQGACEACNGLGKILKADQNIVLSEEISISEGGILPFSNMFEHDTWYSRLVLKVCDENDIDPRTPIKNLTKEKKNILLFGTGNNIYKVFGKNRFGEDTHIYEEFQGILGEIEKRYSNTESDWVRNETEKYMIEKKCDLCKGTRLKKEALNITISKMSISDVSSMSIKDTHNWFNEVFGQSSHISNREAQISEPIVNEISKRLSFLISVGLDYITLEREARTLSGGESQRIRLASQIGSGLTGVLYVLDEPTIGLHQKDNEKLIKTMKELKDIGNTVLVVEHDKNMMKNSDFIVDFGPGAGKFGGEVVFAGKYDEILKDKKSLTGKYLSGNKKIEIYKFDNNLKNDKNIVIYGCSEHNLKNVDLKIPLGKFVLITGVSGSGKSTLLVDTFYPAFKKSVNPYYHEQIGAYEKIEGLENIKKIILIDQSPIGRTPRSNPATYTKLMDIIREVFSQTKEAKIRGFKKGRFSFNLKGGRCEACEGQGQTKIEMQFMSDIWIKCEVCGGSRYNSQTLEISYKGKNIAEVLKLTVSEAKEFFHAHPAIQAKLETLESVGLGYMELGQSALTLSGGEAQRVKLSLELSKKEEGNTLYILDEPTTGLHFADLDKLIKVLKLLVAKGNTVVVIEHNIDVIKNADWIIDLGPQGGDNGGEIIFQGTPTELANFDESYTGLYLKNEINS